MATSKVGMVLEAKATGLNEINKTASELNKNLTSAQKAAKGLGSTKFAAAAMKKESEDYGVTRSLRPGGTGASARDFAQEAQGLGGLVRLYATYAANIFAVGAAFRALSNAMDTTNMVKGLDQLGAASGMALGTLSKRLVVATDGAISLREAMESVAKASSSGMSSENILRMGKVAKQASQALGVDMADAVNRITRGITKLEPELLDEIGIFTRVDSAVKEYAKSVGKSATALTDFERRMAFANAVLEEGERKFSAIEIDTNPYTKLTAAIKNAAQEGLELVNTVLAPIVNLLSQSPTALTAILGTLGLLLVRQALPAIGEFKAGLANAADQATELSIQRAQDAADAKSKIEKLALQELTNNADAKVDAIDRAQARIDSIQSDSVRTTTKLYKTLQDETLDLTTLTDKQIASFERSTKLFEKTGGDSTAVKAEYEAIAALKEGRDAEVAIRSAIEKTAVARKAAEGGIGTYAQTLRIAEKAQTNATKAQIVSSAAYNGSLVGLKDSFALMRADIAASTLQLTAFSRAALVARGGLAILGGAISTLGSVLSGAFMWIGLITGALAIFDAMFSKASKEISNFESGIDSLEQATGNLTRTLDSINSNNPFSVKSLEAQGTAMMEFSSSVDALGKSANKALNALKNSGWDSFKNTVKSIWGGDVQSNFSESLANSISTAVTDLENSPIQTQLQQTLGNILNIKDVTNVKELEKALKGLEPNSAIVKEISKALKQAGIEASNTASKAREFSDAFKKSEESFKNFTKQFDNKDPLVQYAVDSMNALGELSGTISGPLSGSLDNLTTLLNGLNENPIFGIEKSQELAQYANEMGGINKTIVDQTLKVNQLTKAREEQEKVLAGLELRNKNINSQSSAYASLNQGRRDGRAAGNTTTPQDIEKQRAILESTNKALVRAQDNIALASARGNAIATRVADEIPNGITRGKDLLITALDASLAKGANAFKSSILSSFGNLPGVAKAEANVQIGEIGIEKKLLDVQFQMLREQVAIKLATTKSALLAERADLEKEAASTSEQRRAGVQQKLANNLADSDAVDSAMANVRGGKSYKDTLAGIEKLDAKSRELLTGYAISVAGITAKLQQLGQQQLSVRFQAEVKEIQAKAAQAQQILDADTKTLQLSKEQLALRKDLTAEERLANETSINQGVILNTTLKEQAAAAFAYAEISAKIVAYESLKAKSADDIVALEAAKVEQARLYGNILQAGARGQVASAAEDEAAKKRAFELGIKREAQLANIARIEEGITQNSKEAGLSVEEQRLSILQEILGSDSQSYRILQTNLETQRQQLEVEKQISDIKFQSADRLRSLRSEAESAGTDTTRQAQIKAEIDQENSRAAQQIANIQVVALARTEATAAIQAQNDLLSQQNEILASTESLAGTLASAFGSVGEALGGMLDAMTNYAIQQEKSAETQETLFNLAVEAGDKGKYEEQAQYLKAYDKEVKKSKVAEIDANLAVLGSAKKLFKEKTTAHKLISGMEKAMHIQKLAMSAKETVEMIANGAKQMAVMLQNIFTGATEAVVNQGSGDPYTAFARIAAMAAIMSSITGKSISVPGGATAADQQAVQGTGQDYVNGQLVNNGGGVLGDVTAKSEDIAKSLSIIEDNTTETILFDSKALDALRAIQVNTEGLAGALYNVQGLTGGMSGFGTLEKATSGFVGAFAKSVSIIDSGIKATGKLGDILKNPDQYLKQYETVQTYKSGLWGIGSSTKTRVNEKSLDAEIAAFITNIFTSAKTAVIELGKVFEMDTKDVINDIIDNLDVSFQVSAKDLKGTELIEAIAAETGVTMNQITAQVFPFLDQFDKVGEGLLTTLTRVTTEISVVNGMFDMMGVDFVGSFTKGYSLIEDAGTEAAELAAKNAKDVLDAAVAATEVAGENDYIEEFSGHMDSYESYKKYILATEEELQAVAAAEEAYATALKNTNSARYANITSTIEVYESLIELEGGLDKFTERSQFFISNFVPETTKFAHVVNTVTRSMSELGYANVDTREEFYELVKGLDLATVEGRELYSSLMDVAPAFDMLTDKIDDMASSTGMAAESLASTITNAFMSGVDGAEIGKKIANTIQRGMYQAMISGVTNSIAQMVTSQIISPMLSSIVTSGTIVGAVSQATITSVVQKATEMIQALAAVLNSPEFQSVIGQINQLANINFGGISVPSTYDYSNSNAAEEAAKKAADDALKAMDDAFSRLKKAIDAEKKILNEQLKLAEDQLDELKRVYDVLSDNIRSLRDSVTSTAEMSAIQAQQYIASILTSGIIGDPDKLSQAIDTVRARIDEGNYESKFESDKAKLILAGQLEAIKLLADVQMSDAEVQIAALNTQIEQLDAMLDLYQQQIDAIKGVDNSVLSVAAAVAKMEAALLAALTIKSGGTSSSSSSSGSGQVVAGPFVTGPGGSSSYPTFATDQERIDYQISQFEAAGKPYHVTLLPSGGITVSAASSFDNQNRFYGVNDPRNGPGGKAAPVVRVGPSALGNAFEDGGYLSISKFADGGAFTNSIVSSPTVFDVGLMGEAGPEAIMPLTRGADGSLGVVAHNNTQAALVEEIRDLKRQQQDNERQIAHLLTKVAKSTEESRKLLDEVVRGGEAITVTSEIATY